MNKNYVPLYRKYRPQTLDTLVGQEHVKKTLTSAIELGKIAHAFLFTGPRGTGKTSTARILAKSLNCKNGPTIHPCGECESCRDITNSVPIDVIEIDAASNRTVEDAQNILEKIQYVPVHGKYKIYIIDEIHMLSNHAFNALLKTLEEPPENVIFILATTEVHKVLDTIKSRCQRFDFRRITTDDIVKHLRYISDQEKIKITDDALYTIAKNSAGGMRDSISLLDQLSLLGVSKEITTDDVNSILGRISFDVLHTLSDKIISSSPKFVIISSHDVSLAAFDLFFKNRFNIDYKRADYANNQIFELWKREGKYYFKYLINLETVGEFEFYDFKSKVLDLLYSDEDIKRICYDINNNNYLEHKQKNNSDKIKIINQFLILIIFILIIALIYLIMSKKSISNTHRRKTIEMENLSLLKNQVNH